MTFDDLGFPHDFELELEPEFPGDGDWSGPTRGFSTNGGSTAFLESSWGAPTIVRIRPAGEPPWTASFPGGSLGSSFRGFFGVPSAHHVLVVMDGWGAIVDARSAEEPAEVVGHQLHQVVRVPDEDIVLLGGMCEVTAVGHDGRLWRSPRLFYDELQIVRVEREQILCSGYSMGTTEAIIDLRSGQKLSGPPFP